MRILGLYDGHNANAALIEDGKIVRAVEEERFSRVKNHDGRRDELSAPFESVKYCLEGIDSLDAIALPLETPEALQKRAINSFVDTVRSGYSSRLETTDIRGVEVDGFGLFQYPYQTQQARLEKIKKYLRLAGVDVENTPFIHINHHLAHVASVYFSSNAPESLIVTHDGKGDDLCGMVAIGSGGKLEVVEELNYIHSIGHLYSAITVACGYKAVRHEGKITGLAAHAKPDPELYRKFGEIFTLHDGVWEGRLNAGLKLGPYPHTLFGEQLEVVRKMAEGMSKESMSATVQTFTEEMLVGYIREWVRKTGQTRVLLAGGVFANVKLNQGVHEIDGVEEVYVHPAMSDAGLGVGAALMAYYQDHPYSGYSFNDAFFGPEYSDDQILEELEKHGVTYSKPEDIEDEVAKILADGKLVARFSGRLEYGPRALGNRSILYQTTDKTVNDWLNKHLSRTEFMPFAPITLLEAKDRCFLNTKGTEHTAQFMTITYDCTKEMMDQSPAVVHIDGTARPQLVSEENNPGLYKILKRYNELTGIPSLINTSFNVHEEPIVCSPEDAIRSFRQCEFDYMQLGPYLVRA